MDINYKCNWIVLSVILLAANLVEAQRFDLAKYDVSRLPPNLQPISWLVGVWRSELGGTVTFPTIPVFSYGEEVRISLSDHAMRSSPALNYTAVAWSEGGPGQPDEELHSENGYITVRGSTVSLTTVMNNGFVTIEEGFPGTAIRFKVVDIGRISFSRDLPVLNLAREWVMMGHRSFSARLDMETLTHRMQTHTQIVYNKIFP